MIIDKAKENQTQLYFSVTINEGQIHLLSLLPVGSLSLRAAVKRGAQKFDVLQ